MQYAFIEFQVIAIDTKTVSFALFGKLVQSPIEIIKSLLSLMHTINRICLESVFKF